MVINLLSMMFLRIQKFHQKHDRSLNEVNIFPFLMLSSVFTFLHSIPHPHLEQTILKISLQQD